MFVKTFSNESWACYAATPAFAFLPLVPNCRQTAESAVLFARITIERPPIVVQVSHLAATPTGAMLPSMMPNHTNQLGI